MFVVSGRKKPILSAVLLQIVLALVFFRSASAQTTWEFSGTPYAYQKAHFDSATNVVKRKLGVQMRTFGAPYNKSDATLAQVMSEDPNYKVMLFGEVDPLPGSGQVNLTNRVMIESATGVPDYAYFLTSYNAKKALYTDYMVMQGHPYAWTTADKRAQFQQIVNFLIGEGVEFTTPYAYYQYLTDGSIPRTTKVQVILKLDDLRSTTSYFDPCLPTYDFLAAGKIKAAFGVNKMEALTAAQTATLNSYLAMTDEAGAPLFEVWNHGLDHSMTAATLGGNWSDPATWPSGQVPTASDDVEIPAGVTITIDAAGAVCENLTVNGTLSTSTAVPVSLTVNGDVLINAGGTFTSPYLAGATSNVVHTMTVYGDFTNAGGTFDFRAGSAGSTMRVLNTTFLGAYNSTITVGTYSSANNDFNSITVNKSDGAKLVCASDVVCDPGSSACTSQLTLTNGVIETGEHAFYALSTATGDVIGGSSSSYVNGALGRGMSNSGGKVNAFPVGDARAYRPISVRSTTSGTATGHYVLVRCIPSQANTGASVFTGGIDAVSSVRHYQVGYYKGLGAAATSMSFSQFNPSYGADDGVQAGNTNLRVAYSTDAKATWIGMSQTTTHTTSLASPPTTITPTALATPFAVNDGASFYVSLATATGGTTDDPLPVELTRFTASAQGLAVVLAWSTATETNNYGFEVERRLASSLTDPSAGAGSGAWQKAGFVSGCGTSAVPREYGFEDKDVQAGTYAYRLKQIDRDGAFSYSSEVEVETGLAPKEFRIIGAYPNPFNPASTIRFSFAAEDDAALKIFNLRGQVVATLFEGRPKAGVIYERSFDAAGLASGVYFARLRSGARVQVQKLILMK